MRVGESPEQAKAMTEVQAQAAPRHICHNCKVFPPASSLHHLQPIPHFLWEIRHLKEPNCGSDTLEFPVRVPEWLNTNSHNGFLKTLVSEVLEVTYTPDYCSDLKVGVCLKICLSDAVYFILWWIFKSQAICWQYWSHFDGISHLFFWVCCANSTLARVLVWQQRIVNYMIYMKIKMAFEYRGYEIEVRFPSANLELRASLMPNFSSLSQSLLAFSCLYFILWVSGCTNEDDSPRMFMCFIWEAMRWL